MAALFDEEQPTLYFYGHGAANEYGFLSQFYTVGFDAPSATEENKMLRFWCAEQYMMYRKAVLFEDHDIAEQIMLKLPKDKPVSVKALGRRVKGWDEKIWEENREQIVEDGNWYKFTKSPKGGLKNKLLATADRELVEAAPRDSIWGIGFGKDKAPSNRPRWGLNLLGKALMRVRQKIKEEDSEAPSKSWGETSEQRLEG